jgi:DNA-binding NarL/FixJ family response regulator
VNCGGSRRSATAARRQCSGGYGAKSFDIADRLPQEVVRKSDVFNTVWRPFGVERQLLGYLWSAGEPMGFACAARSIREPAFTASDLSAFERVRALVEQEVVAARHLTRKKLHDVLAVLSVATTAAWFLFDSSANLLWLTEEARTRLSVDAVRMLSSTAICHSESLEQLRAWIRRKARSGEAAYADAPELRIAAPGERFMMRRFDTESAGPLFLVGFAEPPPVPARDATSDGDVALRVARMARRHSLTPRQTEVLAHLAWGKANKAIAALLGCSESTVELHVTALLGKSGCEGRAELVARFWTG